MAVSQTKGGLSPPPVSSLPPSLPPLNHPLSHPSGHLVINDGVDPAGVLQEAKFFGLSALEKKLKKMVDVRENTDGFTRKQFVNILLTSTTNSR